jgi:quercetin dioxygenase-like cupin family protein
MVDRSEQEPEMNKLIVLGVIVAAAVTTDAQAQKSRGKATLTAASSLTWSDVPGFAGLKMSVADGNPAKGASHFFIKFDKGFTAGDHHHTGNHFVTVLSGTLILTVDGVETSLPPGSFFSFTGKKVHATKCDAAADCVLFIDARSKWDVVPKPAPKK